MPVMSIGADQGVAVTRAAYVVDQSVVQGPAADSGSDREISSGIAASLRGESRASRPESDMPGQPGEHGW